MKSTTTNFILILFTLVVGVQAASLHQQQRAVMESVAQTNMLAAIESSLAPASQFTVSLTAQYGQLADVTLAWKDFTNLPSNWVVYWSSNSRFNITNIDINPDGQTNVTIITGQPMTNSMAAGNVTSATVSNLPTGQTWYFAAYDALNHNNISTSNYDVSIFEPRPMLSAIVTVNAPAASNSILQTASALGNWQNVATNKSGGNWTRTNPPAMNQFFRAKSL